MIPLDRASRGWLAAALLATVATWLLFVLDRAPGTSAARIGFPLDDAWIHLVYARALVTEGGFHYNAGVPEAGMTSPLWVVLLAPVFALTRAMGAPAIVLGAKLLSLACGLAGAAVLFALDPALTFSRAAGMEVPLFTALALAALWSGVRGRVILAGIALGLAIVARPEGGLMLPLVAALLARREVRAAGARRFAIAAACAVTPALLASAWCLHATGAPLPNTFYEKFAAGLSWETLALGWSQYVHGDLPYFTLEIGVIAAVVGVVVIVRRAGLAGALTLGAFALLFAGTLATRHFRAGHYHYWERWLIPAFPGLLLAMAAGVGWPFEPRPPAPEPAPRKHARGRRRDAPITPAWAESRYARIAAVAGLGLLAAGVPRALIERAHTFAWNCQNIEEVQVALGRWVDTHLPPRAVIAVNDAGALRWFGNRVTVDLIGLNDHGLRRALAEGRGGPYLVERGVRWLVVFPGRFPELIAAPGTAAVYGARSTHYTVGPESQAVTVVYRWNPPRP